MGIYDVPAVMLIEEAAKDFKTRVKKPAFTDYVKTGSHKERVPNNPDWFFTRMGAVLYRTYKEGNLGTGRLRTYFGGRKNRGVRPEKKIKASGKILRTCLQMLEKEGLVKKDKKGRKVTPKGEKFLFEKSKIVQVVFNESLKKKKISADEDAQKRIANRKAAEQKAQAAPAVPAQKGMKPMAPQGVPNANAQHHSSQQAQKAQDGAHAQAQGNAPQHKHDDGRGRTEAKKA